MEQKCVVFVKQGILIPQYHTVMYFRKIRMKNYTEQPIFVNLKPYACVGLFFCIIMVHQNGLYYNCGLLGSKCWTQV